MPLEPEVAKNGNIYNIWTLDLKTGELRQYTDALGGNVSPVVLNDRHGQPRSPSSRYYKGEYGIHTLERKEPLHTAATADFGAPGPIIDFQAPLQHTLVADNSGKKGTFEKMFLEGRPPVNVGVTSNGDVFGGTADQLRRRARRQAVQPLRRVDLAVPHDLGARYVNLARRFQYALQGFSQTQFFYGQQGGVFYDPSLAPIISRDLATATRTVARRHGVRHLPAQSVTAASRSRPACVQLNEEYNDPTLQALATQYQQQTFGQPVFRNGTLVPLRRRVRPGDDDLPRVRAAVGQHDAPRVRRRAEDRQHAVAPDDRRRRALLHAPRRASGVLALRVRGFQSIGDFPDFLYFGGNSEMRGYDYLQFVGQNVVFADAELRFPLIEAALTPIGVIGGVRGVFFANIGGAWFDNQGFRFADRARRGHRDADRPASTIGPDHRAGARRSSAPKTQVTGFRLVDGRASYGLGLETLRARLPDSLRLVVADAVQPGVGRPRCSPSHGPAARQFRKPQFAVWIGYDFCDSGWRRTICTDYDCHVVDEYLRIC